MRRTYWVITWKHARGPGETMMEETISTTRRDAWSRCFNWYVEGDEPGSADRLEHARLYYQRKGDNTHRAVKVKISKVTP